MKTGAGNGVRTRDPELGKLVLYQLSYTRIRPHTAHFPTIRQAEILPLLADLASSHTGKGKKTVCTDGQIDHLPQPAQYRLHCCVVLVINLGCFHDGF
jgi:hypothetical protein